MARLELSSGAQEVLKWFAILCMFVDHLGVVFLTGDALVAVRGVGRMAFPLFAFLLAYNLVGRRVRPARYVLPLLGAGLVSQPVYGLVFGVPRLNILFTLLAAVLLFWLLTRHGWAWGLLAAPGLLLVGPWLEYGSLGVLFVLALCAALEWPGWQWTMVAVALAYLVNAPSPLAWYALGVVPIIWQASRGSISFPRSSKWVFYGFYPVHLAALVVVHLVVSL